MSNPSLADDDQNQQIEQNRRYHKDRYKRDGRVEFNLAPSRQAVDGYHKAL